MTDEITEIELLRPLVEMIHNPGHPDGPVDHIDKIEACFDGSKGKHGVGYISITLREPTANIEGLDDLVLDCNALPTNTRIKCVKGAGQDASFTGKAGSTEVVGTLTGNEIYFVFEPTVDRPTLDQGPISAKEFAKNRVVGDMSQFCDAFNSLGIGKDVIHKTKIGQGSSGPSR